eukprot:6013250-Amphidinium_carterae.1
MSVPKTRTRMRSYSVRCFRRATSRPERAESRGVWSKGQRQAKENPALLEDHARLQAPAGAGPKKKGQPRISEVEAQYLRISMMLLDNMILIASDSENMIGDGSRSWINTLQDNRHHVHATPWYRLQRWRTVLYPHNRRCVPMSRDQMWQENSKLRLTSLPLDSRTIAQKIMVHRGVVQAQDAIPDWCFVS